VSGPASYDTIHSGIFTQIILHHERQTKEAIREHLLKHKQVHAVSNNNPTNDDWDIHYFHIFSQWNEMKRQCNLLAPQQWTRRYIAFKYNYKQENRTPNYLHCCNAVPFPISLWSSYKNLTSMYTYWWTTNWLCRAEIEMHYKTTKHMCVTERINFRQNQK